jgi:hypothetical protein
MIHPGPPSLAPGLCPGGVVIHVYTATAPPVLVVEQQLRPGDAIDNAATEAALMHDGDVCLVAYDGDSGERYPANAWEALP